MNVSLSKLKSREYREQKELDYSWAGTIKARDGWKCVICGDDYAPNAHHIIPREHKEYRYCLDNGITLCRKHHKFSRVISAHNNPFAFFLWLSRFQNHFSLIAIERTLKILENEGIVCT